MRSRFVKAALALFAVTGGGVGCHGPSAKKGAGIAPPSESGVAKPVAPRAAAVAPPQHAVPAQSSGPLPPLDAAGPGWQVGHRYGYRLALASKVSFAAQVATDYELRAELRLTCIKSGAEETTLLVELDSPRVTSKSADEQAELERGLSDLAAPFFATFERGVLGETRIDPGMKPSAVATYRTIVAALQLARPVGSRQAFQAREHDSTGEYLVDYRRDPSGLITKQKLRYLSVLLPGADRAAPPANLFPNVVSSRAEVRATRDGQPLQVEWQEELALRELEAPMLAAHRVSLRWLGDELRPSVEDERARLAETRRLGVDEPYVPTADAAVLDSARIAGKSFESILGELAALPRGEPDRSESGDDASRNRELEQQERQQQRLIVALAATFRQRPETIEQAIARIRAGAPIRGDLLDGLSASGSDASQLALARVVESSAADPELRHAAVFALSRSPSPSKHAIRALVAELDDEHAGTQALYGLGTFCRLLREAGDLAAADELGRLLVQRLSAAEGELALTRALRAIANSGYLPALAAVKPLLEDDREAVRADAVEAIRLMDAPSVDALLAERLTAESSVKARLAALDAFAVRKPTAALSRALGGALRHAEPHVRYRAAEVATAWLERLPELRVELARVARHDGEERIRKLASAALAEKRPGNVRSSQN